MNLPRGTMRVLQAIWRSKKPNSKAELVKLTGFSLATVTEHVETLIRSNLVKEVEMGHSTGGRRPRLLSFNNESGYIIGIDLESTHVQVGIADLNCDIVVSKSSEIDVGKGPLTVLEHIKEMVFSLLDEHKIEISLIKGIGMGVPGPVEYSTGLPGSLPIMPGWDRYPIRQFWNEYFNCPCYVDNNVFTRVLGERTVEAVSKIDNLIYLKIGNGIGAGIICNGQIYRGSIECAGDVGHINVGHDVLCYCGNRGCLEAIAGGRAIVRRAEEIGKNGHSKILSKLLATNRKLKLEDVNRAVRESDPLVVELIRECGLEIGKVIGGLINFFNPSLVCIGGKVSEVGDVLLASIRQGIYSHSSPLSTRNLVIQQSLLGEKVGIIGAAVLTVDKIIENSLQKNEEGVFSF
ncbi:ROK family protein [Heyndrickxia acidicola]|uniref:ROK family transcriptional regulator n=1 Tax=Heyndrickxia acidicola TaxID=209389 RepID=A0ABU6MLJ9_9BACI|nr:ROK family transcriptional regulator [Heyndrickxia acidicola]MED1205564.1 ROK family transcriptional regulator [Heyndrickxia acidicola]